jgi:flagellar assembly factor FliW
MNVKTTRFGTVQVAEERIIHFVAGVLGFGECKRYALLQPDEDGVFFWLQSIDAPDLAFVVTDPALWIADYQATIRREQMDLLNLESLDDAQVFVIVNKYGRRITANLQGPLVLNARERRAMQLVLAERRWSTRFELITLGEAAQAIPA